MVDVIELKGVDYPHLQGAVELEVGVLRQLLGDYSSQYSTCRETNKGDDRKTERG